MLLTLIFFYLILSAVKNTWLYILSFLIPEAFVLLFNKLNVGDEVVIKEWYVYSLSIVLISYIATLKDIGNLTRLACVALCLLSVTLTVDAYYYGLGGVGVETITAVNRVSSYIAFVLHGLFIASFINVNAIKNGSRAAMDSILRHTINSYTCDISKYEIEE